MKHSVNFCNRISKFLFLICLVSTSYIKPLKILVAVEVFPSSLQIFILNQITGLIDAGHDVHIFAFRDKQVGIENPIIPTDVIKYNLLSKTYYQQLPDLSVFDILYCQFGSTANKLLPLLAHYTTTPKFITCLRGGDASTAFIKDPHVYDELFKKADYLFPVCKHFAKRLIAYGCPPEKIIVHHSSIDCNAFEFTERTLPKDTILRLTTVGRLYKEKGHEHAIKAVAQLAKKYTNIHYKIIGDGPYKKELEKLIAKLNMQKTIELAGLVSHDSMPQELALTHIFILTPFTLKKSDGMTQIGMEEGIPNALMEAMACGIPVIGTRHAGIPELIQNNISGLLVEERNVEQIYDALDWFISHSDSWAQFGKKGRKHVLKHHNITHQISRLDKLFKKLTSKNLLPVTRNYEHIITSFDFWD